MAYKIIKPYTDFVFRMCKFYISHPILSIPSFFLSYDELKMEYGPIKCIRSSHMSGRS